MKHIWKIILGVIGVVMLLGAGCESGTVPGTHHWRRATQTDGSAETLVFVMVPATNPVTGAQGIVGTPVEGMIRRVVARWDATPDLALALSFQTTGGSNACPGDNFGNNKINCINVWRVTNQYLHDRYGANVAGAAPVWGDSTHFYNGPGASAPTEPSRVEVANDWSGFNPIVEENAYCHELGHVWDLQHPTDGSAGPCDGSAIVDADDASALDTTIDACHFDGPSTNTPPAGSTPYGGNDSCGGAGAAPRTADSVGSPPTLHVTGVHSFTDFQHQTQ